MTLNYSIIIPHRDSFELLKRALDSVPDRSDIQIIIIDNTPYNIDFSKLGEKRKNKCQILYSDPEKGAGHARNVGLKKVICKWLLFLDADDFFSPGAFEQFDKYINSKFDIIYFSVTSVFSDNLGKVAERHIPYAKLVSEFVKGGKNAEDKLRYWHVSPWSKLIRTKFVLENGIFFEEVPASNDLMFSVKTGHFADKIWADDFPAYIITVGPGSLTHTITVRNSRSRYCVFIRQYKFMEAIGKPDMRFNLMAYVLKSLRFGLNEFYWYLVTAHRKRVNIFLGSKRWPGVLLAYLFKGCKKNML